MKLKKYDYIIFAVLAFITIFSILVPFLFRKEYDQDLVVIEIDGKEYKSFPLDKNATIPIKIAGNYNLIEIIDGKVHVAEANCHDELCVKDGYISKPGQMLICLPHKVVVQISGTDIPEIDESTY
ncbi:NusG domain II-containing protein [Clostridium thermarum]|uniref:NusG domain II-containing protein n=1 Tax=Clostridium thermarum TaxID=1716543 RepID=UPI00111F901B|nr:NusG domain II-containing protein [Clostridium thermarum]